MSPKVPWHSLSKSTLLTTLYTKSSIECLWTLLTTLSILHIPSENYSFYFLWKHFILFQAHVLLLCWVVGTQIYIVLFFWCNVSSYGWFQTTTWHHWFQNWKVTHKTSSPKATWADPAHSALNRYHCFFSRMNIILWQLKDKLGVRDSFGAKRTVLLNRAGSKDTGQKQSDSK